MRAEAFGRRCSWPSAGADHRSVHGRAGCGGVPQLGAAGLRSGGLIRIKVGLCPVTQSSCRIYGGARDMTFGEWAYLGMVIVAFLLFGIVLSYASLRAPGS